MIASVVAWFAARGVSKRALKAAAIILAICLAIALFVRWIDGREDAAVQSHEADVQLEVQTQGRAADQKLNDRIDQSNSAIEQAREEFDNATATLPAEGLTRRQRIDVCIELRDAGTDTTIIPECDDLHARAAPGALREHPDRR
jgi:hypothetical protein